MVDCDCVSVNSSLDTAATWIGIITFITTSLGIISGALVLFNHVANAYDERNQLVRSLIAGDQALKIGMELCRPKQPPNLSTTIRGRVMTARESLSTTFANPQGELEHAIQNLGGWNTPIQWARKWKGLDEKTRELRTLIPILLILQMAGLYLSVFPYSVVPTLLKTKHLHI
ncbi:hypothetical protein B0T10DRAFT_463459 [Thelonectria olida]|uniref:Uncharacterized protein n=1 Tax=Thelonectria olida TaxID=1576542 RepID=A0A9P9ALQ3_9HYPO|nr:hypothetical protein B0T10DRAFT_463459 [Thelonectria olida]